jgi:hypothetical protein
MTISTVNNYMRVILRVGCEYEGEVKEGVR